MLSGIVPDETAIVGVLERMGIGYRIELERKGLPKF